MNTGIDVLCIGDLDVDLFISVPAIPGFDQKVSGKKLGQKPGGMSANAAVAIARLGRTSRLLAAIGDDEPAVGARAALNAEAVDLRFLAERHDTATFMCVVLLSPSGEKSLIKLETDAYLPRCSDLVPEAFDGVRHLHATYGFPELTTRAFRMAAERSITTSLDLEPPDIRRAPERLRETLALVDTLFLNAEAFDELARVLERPVETDLLRSGGEIIVTLGAAGCRRLQGAASMDIPGFPVAALDTTGAGDCFAGAYLVGKLEGFEIRDRLVFANAAAALSTLDFGAQAAMPRRQDVQGFLAASGGRTKTFSNGSR